MRGLGFTCGPFAEVKDRIENFGTALYFTQLYYDTMMQHQELVVQLSEAQNENDAALVKELEEQICFIEHACQITDILDLPYSENN
tara:strand:- start:5835 stop:6092 length:258 start_codon:yes stop_codon:yes gene_type:complete